MRQRKCHKTTDYTDESSEEDDEDENTDGEDDDNPPAHGPTAPANSDSDLDPVLTPPPLNWEKHPCLRKKYPRPFPFAVTPGIPAPEIFF